MVNGYFNLAKLAISWLVGDALAELW